MAASSTAEKKSKKKEKEAVTVAASLENAENSVSTGSTAESARKQIKSEYPSTPEGMEEALEELAGIREVVDMLGIELTSDQKRLRHIIVKYAEQNLDLKSQERFPAIRETNRRIAELKDLFREAVENVLEKANGHFSELVDQIREKDPELLTEMENDLAKLWGAFRSLENSDDMAEVAAAYVAVNNFLTHAITEVVPKRLEQFQLKKIRSSVQKHLSKL